MHLAGVAWWSIRNNEGPVFLIFDLLIGTIVMTVGLGINMLVNRRKSRQPISPSLE
jgi:NADH:ubiquinone oxidoreductase subunit K